MKQRHQYVIYALSFCILVIVLGKITGPTNPYKHASKLLLSHIHDSVVFQSLPTILSESDSNQLGSFFAKVDAPDQMVIAKAFKGGEITGIWNSLDRDSSHLAIRIHMIYDTNYAMNKDGDALFIFKYNNSKWVLDWCNPGTIFKR